MMDAHSPRREFGAREYLAVNFEPSDRLAVLLRNRHRGATLQRITTVGRMIEPTFQEWLQLKNREGFDVYVLMNPLKPAARRRTKEDILLIRHLYVDLDHQAAVSLASIQQSNLLPRPNYILSTSPDKFQVVWRVEEAPQEQAEALLRAMARRFGGDPAATDSTRVLRIPGFRNRKYDEEFVVKAEQHSEHVYHLLDFKLRIDHVDSPYQPLWRSPRRTASTEPRPLTQSEHDWAFAKRAIARGTDPEEVVRRIAQYRNGEKHDTVDYARRTVLKAQAELLGRHSVETPAETEQTESKATGFDP
jgi:hypothetical protein